MQLQDLAQLGTIGLLFYLAIKEFFAWLKSRNSGTGSGGHNEAVVAALEKLGDNHLHHVEQAIKDGNTDLKNTIHQDNMRMIEILGEISGKLDRR